MRKESEDPQGLWYRIRLEERKRLVRLGALFYKQTELAGLLETTSGTIAGFRRDNNINMPVEKLPRLGKQFVAFNELLEFLKAPETPFEENPELDEKAGALLSTLIIQQLESERRMPRWGKCWHPTLPAHRGEPVRYLCEKNGSPLCYYHQRQLPKDKTLILHLAF